MFNINLHSWAYNTIRADIGEQTGSLQLRVNGGTVLAIYPRQGDELPGYGLSRDQLTRIAAIVNEPAEAPRPVVLDDNIPF